MRERPTIETERLVLRPFTMADAKDVQRLAGDADVASTLNIPHPYEDGVAEDWIATHQQRFEKGELVNFAVTLRSDGSLVGAIGLRVNREHSRAELGFWIGKPYWNNGYCTEAARAVVKYGFEVVGLNRIHAVHFKRNGASGRVMTKIGMKHEGTLRRHVSKYGKFEDDELYGILRADYDEGNKERRGR